MELEYIRSCVSTALADVHYRQRGILEVQPEQMRLGGSGRFNKKQVRSSSVGAVS
ncbi:bacteriophage antitermination protein Q [Escherichia coli]|uniref:bacteriophage antitermination protein Q n=1 Tax=Escherichia coli TaxID=562 RepID=UPI0020250852|nr:bacteriophage antitermination protein Q [Escherichia coli]